MKNLKIEDLCGAMDCLAMELGKPKANLRENWKLRVEMERAYKKFEREYHLRTGTKYKCHA